LGQIARAIVTVSTARESGAGSSDPAAIAA
jgi:hypothetical protein